MEKQGIFVLLQAIINHISFVVLLNLMKMSV